MKFANFLGVRVEAVTYGDLFAAVDRWLADKSSRSHHVAVINAYCATLTLRDARLASIYDRADMTGPDGMPFVYWLRAFARRPVDRFYAPDLVLQLAAHARESGHSFYLFGGSPETVEGMRRFLVDRFPYLRIVGCVSPPFRPMTAAEDAAACAEINALKPDILCVGLGTPKQDYWIDDHVESIRGAVFIPCGATFDFFGGRIRMAPRWIQRSGFEWLYRLLSPDFPRLWRRYTVMNAVFLWNFALQLTRIRVRTPRGETRPQ